MAKQQEVIRAFMSSLCDTNLSGEDALDEAVRACSNFNSAQDVRTQMINALNNFGSDTFLSNYCGINLGNRDDGAITGLDAGNGIEKTRESIIPENGSLDTGFTADSFTVKGLTFQLNGTTFYSLGDVQKTLWRRLKTWWAEGALNLIEESYGGYFNFSGKTIYVTFSNNINGGGKAMVERLNDNWKLTLSDSAYASLIAHELTHAVMDNKDAAEGLPQFITEGLAELTRGIDHQYKTTIESLVRNSGTLLENLNFNPGTANWASYAAGYIFLRYLAQQGATSHQAPALFDNEDNNQQNTTSGKVLKALAGNDTIGNWGNYVTLNGGSGNDSVFNDQQGYNSLIDTGDGNDTIWNWGTNSTLNGGDGNDSISNHNIYVTMNGSSGNDTLINWEGSAYVKISGDDGEDYLQNHGYDATIEGGAGNDSVYNEGNSAFINTGVGNDTVRNWQGTYLRIELGDGKDSIENAIGHNTTINAGYGDDYINNSSSNYVSIYAGYGNDFVWNWEGNGTTVELSEGNDSITNWHGSSSTIFGGGGEDFIHNNDANYSSIDAGDGNDFIRNESSQQATLSGGSGNDTISIDGSSSYTMIQYAPGDGYDWIYGYNFGDTISIGGGHYTLETLGSSVVVNVIGSGAMTLDSASDKDIYITGGNLSVPAIFTEGDDYYSNDTPNTVLSALSGNDTIFNGANSVTAYLGAGNDFISQNGYSEYITVDGGAGNDTILGRYWYSSLSGGAGDDVINISSGDVDRATINGGYGNDTIYFDNHDGRNLYQYASGDGYDVIYSLNVYDTIHVTSGSVSSAYASGNDVILNVGSGSMTLKNKTNDYFYLKTGSGSAVQTQVGDIYISNSDSNTVLIGTSYGDTIYNSGQYVTINTGDGNDSINSNNGAYSNAFVTINAGAGNDTIVGRYGDSSISGGAGDDKISMGGDVDRATINGGTGNDIVYLDGYLDCDGRNVIQYSYGDGFDTVYGIKPNDTLKITGSRYIKETVGSDLKISVGSGAILLKNALDISFTIDGTMTSNDTISNTVINGTSSSDSIHAATGNYVPIYAGDGADTITGNYYNSKIYGGAGSDSISVVDEDFYRWSDSHGLLLSKYLRVTNSWEEDLSNTIDGGDGNDTINIIGFAPAYVNGGNGNDRISHSGEAVFLPGRTIKGGRGDDIIYGMGAESLVGDAQGYKGFDGKGTHYEYSYGDGSDTIFNYHSTDTISIAGNSPYTTLTNGNNVVVSVIGSGAMTLYNAKDTRLNIEGGTPTVPATFTENADYYSNTTPNTVLSALSGNDTIQNSAANVTINGGAGADSISNSASSVVANGGEENDSITGSYKYSTLTGGAGDDYISVSASQSYINGGAGNDFIRARSNSGISMTDFTEGSGESSGVTIQGGTGNDVIYNDANTSLKLLVGVLYQYAQGDGLDTIFGYKAADTVSLSGGYYTRETVGNDVIVSVIGSGAMTLYNAKDIKLNIEGGTPTMPTTFTENADYYSNTTMNTVLSALGGNDTIINSAANVTINGDAGADKIISTNSSVAANGGEGNDYLEIEGYYNTINGGAGNDSIYNSGRSTNIYGGSGDDSIVNSNALYVTINGGTGNDTIENYSNYHVINGDAGDDAIYSYTGNGLEINGGEGNDYIYIYGNDSTISGGTGNDSISLERYEHVIVYASGDGNDWISGYNLSDTISIVGSSYYTTLTSGNDVIISLSSGAMTLDNASNQEINITGGRYTMTGTEIQNFTDNTTITGTDKNDTLESRASHVKIYGGAGNDSIYNEGAKVTISADEGDDYISSIGDNVKINAGVGNDSIYNCDLRAFAGSSVSIDAGTGEDFIENLGTNVTIDAGAGNDSIWNYGSSAKIDGGDGNDSIQNWGDNVTISGGKGNDLIYLYSTDNTAPSGNVYVYTIGDGNDSISGYNASDTISISGAKYSTLTSGSEVIVSVTGSGSIKLVGASGEKLNIVGTLEGGGSASTLPAGISVNGATLTASTAFTGSEIDLADYASTVTRVNASALSRGVSIVGNAKANSIKGGKSADTIFGGAGNDTVSLGGGADVYIYSSGNDLIQDYVAGTDKIKLSGTSITSASLSGSDVMLKTSAGNLTVKNGKNKAITVIDASGKETSQVYPLSTSTIPAGISVSGAVLTATAAFTGSEINLADYATNVTKVNASAVTKNISIVGSSAANSLKGGKGADTIFGGAGNDTVSLGGGADVYVYSSGNDLIQDYAAGTDKIKLSGTSITSASVSGSNVVLKTSSGNITVKGRKGKAITVIDASGKETSQVYPLSTLPAGISVSGSTLTASSAFTGSEIDLADYATNVTKVNASALSRGVSIVGNAKANSLKGGKGADTIFGGAGNDTLYGGAGSDTFVYASGKDVIADYAAGDKIKLTSGTISKTAYSGQNVVFTVGSGSLTVRNGKSKKITITDASGRTSTKTYTTGVSYGSNGNAAVTWFTEDDTNFISASANLDEISAEKFSVTNVESTNYENPMQPDLIIIPGDK